MIFWTWQNSAREYLSPKFSLHQRRAATSRRRSWVCKAAHSARLVVGLKPRNPRPADLVGMASNTRCSPLARPISVSTARSTHPAKPSTLRLFLPMGDGARGHATRWLASCADRPSCAVANTATVMLGCVLVWLAGCENKVVTLWRSVSIEREPR